MLQPFGDRGFPKAPLFAAGALIVFTLCVAGASRLVGRAPDKPEGPALASRDLRFEDGADGSVAAFDARDGRLVTRFAPGTNGFLRASLRGLAHRRVFSGDYDPSFHLTAWADGRLTLDDPSTGGVIDLEAFGSSNEAVFAKLLEFRSAVR